MDILRSLSIRNKLIIIILSVTILSIIVGFSIVIATNIKTFKQEMANAIVLNTKLVGRYCVSPLLFQDKKGVEDNLKELSQIPSVEIGQVYDKNGKLFGSYNKTNQVFERQNTQQSPHYSFKANYLEVVEHIIYDNQKFGEIYVRASTEPLQNKINKFLFTMVLLMLGLSVLSFVLAHWLQKIISKPILQLAQTTEKITLEEDYSIRVNKESNDEIGVLYDGFNCMLEQILQRQITIDKALMELQESEDKFKQMTESAFNAILVVDAEGIIHFWNRAAQNIFGYTEKEILGKSLHNLLVSTDDFERFKNTSIKASNTKGEIIGDTFELPAIRKDNSKFPVEVSISPIWLQGKWNAVGIIKDISRWKRTEQELINAKEKAEESDRLKSAFLSNMSHEIRTPMNSIIGFAELLSDPELFEKKRKKYLNYITSSGKSLLNLINDIIDVSKIEAGQLKIKKSEVKINSVLNELYASFNDTHKKQKGSDFDLRVVKEADDNFTIYTDPYRFRQILANLIGNAFKFTDKGFIEFGYTLKEEKGEVEFYVKDTGVGIPQDKLQIIFDRFGQVEETYDKNQSGTGLGLAISKKLSEMLGGTMSVESIINEGSTFYLSIPLKKGKGANKETTSVQPETQKEKKATGIHDWSDKTILIAEDEDINYMFLAEALNFTQAKVIWAKDGKETIKICKTDPKIDLILMDVKMPEMDGYEATKSIKQFRPDLPIIAQTAYAMAGEREKAFQAECDDFITKPIRPKKLLNTLSKYLG